VEPCVPEYAALRTDWGAGPPPTEAPHATLGCACKSTAIRATTLDTMDRREALYDEASKDLCGALERVARAYELDAGRRSALERLLALIHRLAPLERQVMTLYLEDFDAASIGEVTGLSPGNVATRIHRIKKALAQRFAKEKPDE
jgi:DNA-directed RNA polymerase specialized sigma24 family protein